MASTDTALCASGACCAFAGGIAGDAKAMKGAPNLLPNASFGIQ
jgi:hypothetical protein